MYVLNLTRMPAAGEPGGGDGARGGQVRQVRGHRPAEHRRGAHPGPAGARRRGALRLRVHRQVSRLANFTPRDLVTSPPSHLLAFSPHYRLTLYYATLPSPLIPLITG